MNCYSYYVVGTRNRWRRTYERNIEQTVGAMKNIINLKPFCFFGSFGSWSIDFCLISIGYHKSHSHTHIILFVIWCCCFGFLNFELYSLFYVNAKLNIVTRVVSLFERSFLFVASIQFCQIQSMWTISKSIFIRYFTPLAIYLSLTLSYYISNWNLKTIKTTTNSFDILCSMQNNKLNV